MKPVMRVLSIAAAVLAVVALFFGNCLTCPQMAPPHKCCHTGQPPCHQHPQSGQACQSQVLNHFVKADTAVRPVTLALASAAPAPFVGLSSARPRQSAFAVAEYAPPDLLSLHSSFRV